MRKTTCTQKMRRKDSFLPEHSEYRFDEGRQSELSLQNSYTINEEALGG